MSDHFDPYYTWLGIPPEEQPPDHYRLLGIRRFENNPEVISNALGQRQVHIRSYESGEQGVAAKQLLQELSQAGNCLASAEKKGAYDRDLRQKDAPKLGRAPARQQFAKPAGLCKSSANVPVEAIPFTEVPTGPSSAPVPWQTLALLAAGGVGLVFLGGIVLAAALYVTGVFSTRPTTGPTIAAGSLPQPSGNNVPAAIGGGNLPPGGGVSNPTGEGNSAPVKSQPAPSPKNDNGPLVPVQANAGPPLDVLQYVEDTALVGEIRKHQGGGWQTVGQARVDILRLPIEHLPQEYVVDTTVMRLGDATDDALLQYLVVGDRHSLVTVDGYKPTGVRTVVDGIDYKPAGAIKDACEHRGKVLPLNVPVNLKYYVFNDRLVVECNGKTILHWTGGMDRLHPGYYFDSTDLKALFFGASQGTFVLSKFEVRPIGNTGGPPPDAIVGNVPKSRPADPVPSPVPIPSVPTPEPAIVPDPEPKETRLAVPSDEALQKALKLIQETYKPAKPPGKQTLADVEKAKKELADKMLEAAETEPDFAVVHVLLTEARRLKLEVGDMDGAFSVVETMVTKFAHNPAKVEAATLQQAFKAANTPQEKKALAEIARRVTQGALADAEFAAAREAAEIAEKLGDTKFKKDAHEWLEAANRALEQEASHVAALQKLLVLPDDAEANQACGRFLCLMKRDWVRGLPYLAKANHAGLKAAAAADLANPATTDAQIALADKWWELAEPLPTGREKDSLKLRASEWYQRSIPGATGIAGARAASRIKETQEIAGDRSGPSRPTVEVLPDPGNLSGFYRLTRKEFYFDVVGSTSGSLYGTAVYTTDSTLAKAAVHSGVLKAGQAGVVKVTILPGRNNYQGSTQKQITSSAWTSYDSSYKVEAGPKAGIHRPQEFAGEKAVPGGPTVEVLPDPGNLLDFYRQSGKVFYFDVVGNTGGSLYGTGVYTTDSSLATAAVHAGVLNAGQAGVVKVTILPGQKSYLGKTKNGITSSEWSDYDSSYKVERGPTTGIRRPSGAGKSSRTWLKEQILKEQAEKRAASDTAKGTKTKSER